MLTTKQARENQEKYGFNELVEGKKKSTMQIFLEQFKDFLVIILIISAVISGILGDAESAIVIFVVITMNAILGTVQTVKAEQSLNSLKQLSAPEAKVARDGNIIQIPSREVTIGDEVILEAGDCIPADGKLIECASLKVDESALTGESIAVEKNLDEVAVGTALGDQTNKVFSGSFVTYGRGRYEVTAIGMNTEVGKIADLMKNTSEKRTPLQVNLDDFGKKLSILILVFSGIIFGVNVFQGESIGSAFMFAVALAVAAIPEALSSIVTIVLSFGTQKMAKEHAIIRKLQAVEGLGSVSIVCSDKTGTLTQNKMTVEDYYVNEKRIPAGKINLKNENEKLLLRFSILCNDSTNTDGQEIGDPTETALINLGSNLGIEIYHESKRLEALSGNLLALMGLEQQPPQLEAVPLGRVLQSLRRALPQGSPVPTLPRSDAVVLAQPELLCDMLYNLIQNARKATPADGKVEVLLDETPTRLTIRVQDTGCGIPPQELARITEPFYMVDKSRAREQGGSGMGLALCARIAALHGTTLQFASVPSQGTTVSFCLQKAGSQPEVEP